MIKKIELTNFRQFDNLNLNINSKYVIISGNNACGKTTILEALNYASITKSHRTNNNKELIKYDELYATSKVTTDNSIYRVVISNAGKMVSINNQEIKKLSEYVGKLITIFFSPSDLSLITGSPAIRRTFLNESISIIYPSYLKNINQYNKILEERNACLKELDISSDRTYLHVLNEELAEIGKKIIQARSSFIYELNQEINQIHKKLADDEAVKITYNPSLPNDKFLDILNEKENSDIISHQTNYGPHRDDIIFTLNEKEAKNYASQGQIRSFVLSVKILMCKIINKYKNQYPILLLDDVLSELDENRQNKLLKLVSDLGQTFITVTDVKLIKTNILKKYQLINLEGVEKYERG